MWILSKKAALIFAMGSNACSQCVNCGTNSKIAAVANFNAGVQPIVNCIDTNYTNLFVVTGIQNYNAMPFDNNQSLLAKDWQGISQQSFTNRGYLPVGVYGYYWLTTCSGTYTQGLNWITPRITASNLIDNGTTCQITISGSGDSLLPYVNKLQLYQEISGTWTAIGSQVSVPANTQAAPNNYFPTYNLTVNANQSQVPLHFKVVTTCDGLNLTGYADMWLEFLYIPQSPIQVAPPNADLVKFGEEFCKIQQYKCVGRFKDIPNLQTIADRQLLKILSTNDSFINTL